MPSYQSSRCRGRCRRLRLGKWFLCFRHAILNRADRLKLLFPGGSEFFGMGQQVGIHFFVENVLRVWALSGNFGKNRIGALRIGMLGSQLAFREPKFLLYRCGLKPTKKWVRNESSQDIYRAAYASTIRQQDHSFARARFRQPDQCLLGHRRISKQ